ncbi:Hypothetical protein (Fragment) [Durusdinium trenchii]|uniref:Uncharacterized protein n=1 Tax=Durusdinium trenchii TaxID=1381693 RepID=A0ABP0RWI4_9DINO
MSERLCWKGCGCRCPRGFKSCCRGCAKTGQHDSKCLGPLIEPTAPTGSMDPFSADDANPEMTLPAMDDVPSCLPPARWSNRQVPPVKWGMRCAQFAEFLDACAVTILWDQAKKARGYVNLYALNGGLPPYGGLLINWTRHTGCSIALRMNPVEALAAELMVSHCWAEDIEECREALEEHRVQHNISSETVMWFCAFSQYQAGDEEGDVGPSVAEQLALDPFGVVVRHVSSCLGMVVVHTSPPKAEIYSRLWCVYEIAEAVRTETPVRIACSVAYVNSRAGNLSEMLQARTEQAECKNPEDDALIRQKILERMTWAQLDRMIFTFRLKALKELIQKHASKLKSTLVEELRSLAAMERPEKRESARRDPVCLATPAKAAEAETAQHEEKPPGIMQRVCSIFTQILQPPPTLVEPVRDSPEPMIEESESEDEADAILQERLKELKKLEQDLDAVD